MSEVNIDTINNLIETPGSLGDTQGWRLQLVAPPAGCIGMQIALRYYFDTLMYGTAVSPYTRSNNLSSDYHYITSATWEHIFALGLSFANTYPVRNLSHALDLPTAEKSFFGLCTGLGSIDVNTFGVNIQNTAYSNIATHCRFQVPVGSVGEQQSAVLTDQTKLASSLFVSTTKTYFGSGDLGSLPEDVPTLSQHVGRWLNFFPANPTDGAKFTIGLDIRKGSQYEVNLRVFVDTRSIALGNLLDVFSNYEYITGIAPINRSTSTINSDDAWIDGSGNLLLPSYFMHRNGLPGQSFVVKPFQYRYLTP